MASAFARRLMGESTSTGDIAPVMTGSAVLSNPSATGAKRKIPTTTPEQTKKLRNRVVDGIMGRLKEDRDGAVIPSDAKEVKSFDMNDHGLDLKNPEIPGQKIKNPYSGDEPLILPTASLVAPDVTPEAIHPLDPSQLPGADRGSAPTSAPDIRSFSGGGAPAASSPALDTVLARPTGAEEPSAPTTPAMSTESALSRLPGIPAPGVIAASAPSGQALMAANQPMPEHKPGDGGRTVLEAFSKFVPRKGIAGLTERGI